MAYYPIMLNVAANPVMVVGEGLVAAAKLEGLVAAGARVDLFARHPSPKLLEVTGHPGVTRHAREPSPEDFAGVALVIAASQDPGVNQRAAQWARMHGRLVNIVDEPACSDFAAVSQIRRGSLVVGISTSGRAPFLAKALRQYLDMFFSTEWVTLVDEMAALRQQARVTMADPDSRKQWLREQLAARWPLGRDEWPAETKCERVDA